MRYITVRTGLSASGQYVAQVPLYDGTLFEVESSTKSLLEYMVYREIEENEGHKSFSVTWLDD